MENQPDRIDRGPAGAPIEKLMEVLSGTDEKEEDPAGTVLDVTGAPVTGADSGANGPPRRPEK